MNPLAILIAEFRIIGCVLVIAGTAWVIRELSRIGQRRP